MRARMSNQSPVSIRPTWMVEKGSENLMKTLPFPIPLRSAVWVKGLSLLILRPDTV